MSEHPRADWSWVRNHLLNAVVKKGQTSVLVADKGAFLDEADEYLGFGELGVELLVSAVSAFQKPCRKAWRGCAITETLVSRETVTSFHFKYHSGVDCIHPK